MSLTKIYARTSETLVYDQLFTLTGESRAPGEYEVRLPASGELAHGICTGTVDDGPTAVECDWLGGEPHLLALQGACSLGANLTSNGTGALRAAGSGDAVVGYAIAEGETDVSVQVFIQG